MASHVHLRKLSHESAAHHRLAARRRMPIDFDWLGARWEASVSRLFELRSGLESMTADWGGATLLIRTDRTTIADIGAHAIGADIEPLLAGDLRTLVIEAAFSRLADLIEAGTRKRFKLLEGERADDSPRDWFQLRLDDGWRTVLVDVGLDAHGLGFFAEAVRRLPVDPGDIGMWEALPVPIRFMVGVTDLPIHVFDELKRRDVIVLDESWIGPGTDSLVVNAGQRYAAAGILSGRTITLTEAWEETMAEGEEHYLEDGEGLGKLAVRLSFDLGERSMPLAELMQVGPGHVFDLGRDVRKAVTIRANGRPIGEGEIVDVDGQIGVVILRIEPAA